MSREAQLLVAAQTGDVDTLQALLSDGVDVDYSDRFGFTAFHKAVLSSNFEMVQYLCENTNADCLAQDSDSQNALHLSRDPAIVAYLIEDRGLDPSIVDSSGETPLTKYIRNGSLSCLRYLLTSHLNRLDLNARRGTCQETCLHVAVKSKRLEALRLLLDVPGCNPTILDSYGRSFLHVALYERNWSIALLIVQLALEREGENDSFGKLLSLPDRSDRGRSALHVASASAQLNLVQLLLRSPSVDPMAFDATRGTALLGSCRVLRGVLDRLIELGSLPSPSSGEEDSTLTATFLSDQRVALSQIIETLIRSANQRTFGSSSSSSSLPSNEHVIADCHGDTPITALLPYTALTTTVSVRELDLQHRILNAKLSVQSSESEIRSRDEEIRNLQSRLREKDRVIEALRSEKSTRDGHHTRQTRAMEDERDDVILKFRERLARMKLQMEDREEAALRSLQELEEEKDEKILRSEARLVDAERMIEELRKELEEVREASYAMEQQNALEIRRKERVIERLRYRQDSYDQRVRRAKQTLQYL